MVKTFEDVMKESSATFNSFIQEAEEKLKYTKKTTKRAYLEKEIAFWRVQVSGDREATSRFFERYPQWGTR